MTPLALCLQPPDKNKQSFKIRSFVGHSKCLEKERNKAAVIEPGELPVAFVTSQRAYSQSVLVLTMDVL